MRRHKIEIKKITGKTTDADGFDTPVWTSITAAPIWADVLDQGSKEFYAAQAEKREHIIRCNIAYRNDIDDGMRIIWKSKVYEIIRSYNADYRNNSTDIDGRLIEGTVD